MANQRYCGVWGRPSRAGETAPEPRRQSERAFEQSLTTRSDQILVDLAISGAPRPPSSRERAQASLASAEKTLKAKPHDLDARFARAMAFFQLGEDSKALDDLERVIEKAPQFATARQYRAIVHARLGQKKEAQDDLAFFLKGDATESSKLYLAVVVAAELGSLQDEAFAKLEAALKRQPGDSRLAYDAACAYALASRALAKPDRARSESHGASERFAYSRRRSRTATPITIISRRTPISTRSATCPLLSSSSRGVTPIATTRQSGPATHGSIQRKATGSTPPPISGSPAT